MSTDIVQRLHQKEGMRNQYAKNRRIIESLLKKSHPHSSGYQEATLATVDKYIEQNVSDMLPDFTKEQLNWLQDKIDLRKIHYSTQAARRHGARVRFFNKAALWVGVAIYGGVILAIIGAVAWGQIKPLTLSPYEKCQKNEDLITNSNYLDEYCKEDGTVGDKVAERRALQKSECDAKGQQWSYFGDKCNRIAYSTKQECIAGGLQVTVKDEQGDIAGSRECQQNGTTKYVSFDQEFRNLQQENCNIKGNVSYNTSERIYHVPSDPYYGSTTIDTAYGERWFCSEAEARAAGWRRSSSY